MAIRTAAGYEVEIVARLVGKDTFGREVGVDVDVRRVLDGKVYRNWQQSTLVADGGYAEIDAAVNAAPVVPMQALPDNSKGKPVWPAEVPGLLPTSHAAAKK